MAPLKRLEQELFDWIVEYNREHGHSPTIRQMVDAMGLKSNSPIQNRLQRLKEKGYIAWEKGRMRTVQILHSFDQGEGIYVLGTISAGGVVESFTEHEPELLDVPAKLRKPGNYALRVIGDSMIDAHICPNDIVILRPETDPRNLKPGSIVAARVEGEGVTLKHFYQKGKHVRLMPANPNYRPIEIEDASRVQIQGVLIGVFRNY
ncbi:transcriptional repressor LexA [Leptothermofonsia sp. ETS-13]|uniref:transcriptional repressor LexA n=1 Tax=Leptothermofonsia sp. ETS-13 TaxID=3035696 RepID=UPI003BA115D8